jgi:hypothetical protein
MIVDKEQVIDWLEHPVTQQYKSILQAGIKVESDLTRIPMEEMSVEQVGQTAIALANYVRALSDVTDFESVFSEVLYAD